MPCRILLTALLATACSKSSKKEAEPTPSADPLALLEDCNKAVADAAQRTGAPITTSKPDASKAALQSMGASCSKVYKRAGCRSAWASLGESGPLDAAALHEACAQAYCEHFATPKPPSCTPPLPESPQARSALWQELQEAMWRHDWGNEAATAMLAKTLTRPTPRILLDAFGTAQARPSSPSTPLPAQDKVSVLVGQGGYWVGTSAGVAYQIKRCDNALDTAALSAALCELRSKPLVASQTEIEVAGTPPASYQNVVDTMDAVLSAGFLDVGLVDQEKLSVSFPTKSFETREAMCKEALASCTPKGTLRTKFVGRPTKDALKSAPLVVVSRSEIKLGDKRIADAKAPSGGARIEELYKVLKERDSSADKVPGTVILQADKGTAIELLNSVVTTCEDAGYDKVMFAVNRK